MWSGSIQEVYLNSSRSSWSRALRRIERLMLLPLMAVAAYVADRALRAAFSRPRDTHASATSGVDQVHGAQRH